MQLLLCGSYPGPWNQYIPFWNPQPSHFLAGYNPKILGQKKDLHWFTVLRSQGWKICSSNCKTSSSPGIFLSTYKWNNYLSCHTTYGPNQLLILGINSSHLQKMEILILGYNNKPPTTGEIHQHLGPNSWSNSFGKAPESKRHLGLLGTPIETNHGWNTKIYDDKSQIQELWCIYIYIWIYIG